MKKSHRALASLAVLALACGAGALYFWSDPQSRILDRLFSAVGARGGLLTGHGDGSGANAARTRVDISKPPDATALGAPPFALEAALARRMNEAEARGAAVSALSAPAPEKEVVSAEEAARRAKMEKLGYMVPPDYYTKDVKTLRRMAQGGDAYAMVHLGEKYYFELNGNKSNPDYDAATDYPSAARQSFKEALVAGNIRSAAIISELYLQENNPVEAYAWHIVSEQLGDSISADWFRGTKLAQQASEELKRQASARAQKINAELGALKNHAT